MQWGVTSKVDDESTNSYNFNLSFTNMCYCVLTTQYSNTTGGSYTNGLSVSSKTTSKFTVVSWNYGEPFCYIAIGK